MPSSMVRNDSYTDPYYQQQLAAQRLAQQQAAQQAAQQNQQAEQQAAQQTSTTQGSSSGEAYIPREKTEEQYLADVNRSSTTRMLSRGDQMEIASLGLGGAVPGTGSTGLPSNVLGQINVPHGYKITSWSSTPTPEGGKEYNIQLGLDPAELAAHGGEKTSTGSYKFENQELPDFLAGGLGSDFSQVGGSWQYKGTDVESWEFDPGSKEIKASFAPTTIPGTAVDPYASLGQKEFNQKAGFMNVSDAGGINPEIIDPSQEYVPITGVVMKKFNDLAAGQGNNILLQSTFMDVEGAGGIDPKITGQTQIKTGDVLRGTGQFLGGAVASVESLYLGSAVPSVWGAGFEQANKIFDKEAPTYQSNYLASHPNYGLGNIVGEIGQAVIMSKALTSLGKAPEGMMRVKAYDEIPTSFKTQQDLVIGGRTYTKTSDITQAGKIELRGKAILVPEDEVRGLKITNMERGFEMISDEPGSRLTTISREIPSRERYLLNAEDVLDPKKKTFAYHESYIQEGLTQDFMKANRISRLDAGEDFLKESYKFEQKISPDLASGRLNKPAYGGGISETYYGTPGQMRLEPHIPSAVKRSTSLSQEGGDLAKAAAGGEVRSTASGGSGGSRAALQGVLRQEGQLSRIVSGQKYLPVGSQSIYTWAGGYAGAKAAGMEVEQYLGQGAYPGQEPGITRLMKPATIALPGRSIDVGVMPKVVPPINIPGFTGDDVIDVPPINTPINTTGEITTTIPGSTTITIPDQDDDVITSMRGITRQVRAPRKSWHPRRDYAEDLLGGRGKKAYEERINPFKSILEMGQPRHRKGRRSKGAGLLWAIATALAALFSIYFIVSLLLPAIGMLDYQVFNFMNNPNIPFAATWTDTYNTLLPFMRNSFTYLIWGAIFAIIMFVIIQANRREPNEYEN